MRIALLKIMHSVSTLIVLVPTAIFTVLALPALYHYLAPPAGSPRRWYPLDWLSVALSALFLLYSWLLLRSFRACNLENRYFKVAFWFNVVAVLFPALHIAFVIRRHPEWSWVGGLMALADLYAALGMLVISFAIFLVGYLKNKKRPA